MLKRLSLSLTFSFAALFPCSENFVPSFFFSFCRNIEPLCSFNNQLKLRDSLFFSSSNPGKLITKVGRATVAGDQISGLRKLPE